VKEFGDGPKGKDEVQNYYEAYAQGTQKRSRQKMGEEQTRKIKGEE